MAPNAAGFIDNITNHEKSSILNQPSYPSQLLFKEARRKLSIHFSSCQTYNKESKTISKELYFLLYIQPKRETCYMEFPWNASDYYP